MRKPSDEEALSYNENRWCAHAESDPQLLFFRGIFKPFRSLVSSELTEEARQQQSKGPKATNEDLDRIRREKLNHTPDDDAKRKTPDERATDETSRSRDGKGADSSPNAEHMETTDGRKLRRFSTIDEASYHKILSKMRSAADVKTRHAAKNAKP